MGTCLQPSLYQAHLEFVKCQELGVGAWNATGWWLAYFTNTSLLNVTTCNTNMFAQLGPNLGEN